ncbi:MAG: hypothetical protein WDM96_15480 [Lacunisphaera sp.]
MLLPKNGRYYFTPQDTAMVNLLTTLGVKSLRFGGNPVDDPKTPMPDERDIDHLFNFGHAAGVKIIYSFRLKNGKPAKSAHLAGYIAKHYADTLDCFAIGNEPDVYFQTFSEYYVQWKKHYEAILKLVPSARFDGPSVAYTPSYPLDWVQALGSSNEHLAMASDHYYFFGSGREGEKNPSLNRARFLSNRVHNTYRGAYNNVGAVLAAKGVPYRIDELNSCSDGGARGSSDTYVSALWVLDCIHWWASHSILGVNFHTGEYDGSDPTVPKVLSYSAFARLPEGQGFEIRPQAYGCLAFSQGAHGQPLSVKSETSWKFDFNAYAYRNSDKSIYLTLINKFWGKAAKISLKLPEDVRTQNWQRMDLTQQANNVAARDGLTFGGAPIDAQGIWAGQWKEVTGTDSQNVTIEVAPLSSSYSAFSG